MMTINLRDYQIKCLRTISKSYERGTISQLIVLPTGTGKTEIFVQCALDFNWPSLILVHRDELAGQVTAKLIAAGVSPTNIGIVMGDQDQLGRKVIIGSVQTLSRSGGKRLDDLLKVLRPRIVVINEAHHAVAKGYRTIIGKVGPELLLGFTAMPMRMDGKHLVGNVFDRITFRRSIIEMVMAGFLTPPKRKVVNTETDLSQIRSQKGDYNRAQLGRALDDDERHQRIVQAWHKYGKGRKTIVFAVDVINAQKLASVFCDTGIDARVIHGKLSKTDRSLILEAYEFREFNVLVSCETFTESFDDQGTDCVLMARPTLSEAMYIQMIGRSLRLFEGKTDALIIDVIDNSLKRSITFQDIMPEARDNQALLREMPRAQLKFFKSMQTKTGQRGQTDWFTGDSQNLDECGIYHDPHYRWIKYGDNGYALSIGKGESVHIIRGELTGNMVVLSNQKDWIVEHPLLPEYAFAVAEQWAMDRAKQLKLKKPFGWTELSWWDLYPTEKQSDYAKKLGVIPGKTMAETSYRIDERSLMTKFSSVVGWLERRAE